ncbi:hypothetical protein [Embleya sp. NPDC059237]|uniref:hypothetical protein n=1 Tax=Embleya sp. NPDC059237 TaxID=3346784 RepID=UPI0036BEFE46
MTATATLTRAARSCACGTALSRYNDNDRCGACLTAHADSITAPKTRNRAAAFTPTAGPLSASLPTRPAPEPPASTFTPSVAVGGPATITVAVAPLIAVTELAAFMVLNGVHDDPATLSADKVRELVATYVGMHGASATFRAPEALWRRQHGPAEERFPVTDNRAAWTAAIGAAYADAPRS